MRQRPIAQARQIEAVDLAQDLHPSGAVGDATLATAAKGDAALARGAQAFVELLREIDRFDLSRLRDGPLSHS